MKDLSDLRIFLASLLQPLISEAVSESLKKSTLSSDTPKQSEPDLLRYIPIQDIFKRRICSKPTFYAHLKNGEFTLYKFGNKSFVDRLEFEKAFHAVKLNAKKGDIK